MTDRKSEILELANTLVKSVGYDGFSYADLSDKLGITKASIHHHFPHKEDLGAALCDSYASYLREKFAAAASEPTPAWDKLEKYFAMGSAHVEDQGQICPVTALQAQVTTLPPPMREKLKELDRIELEFVAQVLERGRGAGELTFKGEPAAQAALMLAAYKGALQLARVQGCSFLKDVLAQMKTMVGV